MNFSYLNITTKSTRTKRYLLYFLTDFNFMVVAWYFCRPQASCSIRFLICIDLVVLLKRPKKSHFIEYGLQIVGYIWPIDVCSALVIVYCKYCAACSMSINIT